MQLKVCEPIKEELKASNVKQECCTFQQHFIYLFGHWMISNRSKWFFTEFILKLEHKSFFGLFWENLHSYAIVNLATKLFILFWCKCLFLCCCFFWRLNSKYVHKPCMKIIQCQHVFSCWPLDDVHVCAKVAGILFRWFTFISPN